MASNSMTAETLLAYLSNSDQDRLDEWQDSRSHLSQQSMTLLDPANHDRLTTPLSAGLAA